MPNFFPYKTRRRYSESEGVNVEHTFDVRCQAFGKSNSDVSPYLIPNEWIAANIASFLRLPIPPFVLLQNKSGRKAMFGSLSFSGANKPISCKPDVLYRTFPRECSGVVLFDMLIANRDRNSTNIKVDNRDQPRDWYIFDHERSLFFLYPKRGIESLRQCEDRFGVTDGHESNEEFHCLIEKLDSIEHITEWLTRIRELPNWFIEDICREVNWRGGITKKEYLAAVSFLCKRRDSLGVLLQDNKARFPNIKDWPLFL